MRQLTTVKGFHAYLTVVFINAFVDLGHKIVIQNTIFKMWEGDTQVILTAIINGLILLPFIFLFSPAGFLSDRYSKPKVLRYGALAAIAGTALITLAYFTGQFWLAFVLTLLLSIQSAIYSPAKYGYIRELLGSGELARGNAWVQAVTIVSILTGTFLFSILFEGFYPVDATDTHAIMQAITPIGAVLVGLSVLEWVLASWLPSTPAGNPAARFEGKKYVTGGYLKLNLELLHRFHPIWLSVIGLSLFWAVSQVVLASFPAFAKEVLQETNTILIQGLLAASGIGIVIGSAIAGRMSRHYIELGLVPVGALGVAGALLVLPTLSSVTGFAVLFLVLGLCGGFLIVPLNALIQYRAPEEQAGAILAGNNWLQNIAMLLFLGLTVLFSVVGIQPTGLFYLLAAIAVGGAIFAMLQLPHALARVVANLVFRRRYRIRAVGFENLPKEGGVLLLGNHISWLDWAMVQIASPRPVRFVMERSIYSRWYLKPVLNAFGVIPISTGNSRGALAEINKALKEGEVVCLFPEGAIGRTGQLGEFRSGYERAIEGADEAVIVPFYLRGLWGSRLSRSYSEKLRSNTLKGLKRNVIVAFGEALAPTTNAQTLKQKVFELSVSAWQHYTCELDCVPKAWLKQAKRRLLATSLIDYRGKTLRNVEVLTATLLIAKRLRRTDNAERVGLMMPASSAGTMTNMAVMLNGQTAVNLNFTAGVDAVQAGIVQSKINTVFTSSRFLQKLAGKGVDTDTLLANVQVVFLEELMADVSTAKRLRYLACAALLPATWLYRLFGCAVELEHPAQIIFSSGSEGTPKGVVLSHRNLMGNIKQTSDVLNTTEDDVMLASLPLFHSFGLTVNSLLPMVEGIPALCCPDPTDVVNVAKAIGTHKVTILCATSTLLRLYTRNRRVHPLMLSSLRFAVAGAEKLSQEVREGFEAKFQKNIYEGYGATETSPVASVNVPDRMDTQTWRVQPGQKLGTVGLPLPGSCFRIVDPETYETLEVGEDGMVLISGGQVMLGYLNDPESTAQVIIELDGRRWYKTGDKGHLDSDGFLTIVDRYSRFAKIGGEMISLSSVEQRIRKLITEEVEVAVTHTKDEKKGERILLLMTPGLEPEALRQRLIASGMDALMIPSRFIVVDELPKLGSGKLDFSGLKQLALAREAELETA